jgi:hypothetical protein
VSTPVTISKIRPDFDLLYGELYQKLAQRGTWKDALPTSVGTTILDMFAGCGVTDQYYIEMALREAFLGLARRDSSIFAGVRWLGVQIRRNTPAGVTVSAVNNYAEVRYVAPYTQFQLDGVMYFNREQIELLPASPIDIYLYQGTVKNKTFDLDTFVDRRNSIVNLGSSGFSASDILVYTEDKVTGNTTLWIDTEDSLWEYSATDRIYYVDSTPAGDVAFTFGDGVYGAMLPPSSYLKVRYVETDGASANSGVSGINGYCQPFPNIKVVTVSTVTGGANRKDALYYKLFGNRMFRSGKRWTSDADIEANLQGFPGIADVKVLGQRDIAPNDPSWMNVIRLIVLPENTDTLGGANPNPQSAAWANVRALLKGKIADMLDIQNWNPEKMFVIVRIKIAIRQEAVPNEVRLAATERLLALFEKKPGILGRRLALDDLREACRVDGVDYVQILSPVEDIVPDAPYRYVALDGVPDLNIVFSERTFTEGAYAL